MAGETMELEHDKMAGEEPREVLYHPARHLARVRLDRGESVMEYVRNEPTLELPLTSPASPPQPRPADGSTASHARPYPKGLHAQPLPA